jgi:hypothetical protein
MEEEKSCKPIKLILASAAIRQTRKRHGEVLDEVETTVYKRLVTKLRQLRIGIQPPEEYSKFCGYIFQIVVSLSIHSCLVIVATYTGTRPFENITKSAALGSVVRRPDSAIHWI